MDPASKHSSAPLPTEIPTMAGTDSSPAVLSSVVVSPKGMSQKREGGRVRSDYRFEMPN